MTKDEIERDMIRIIADHQDIPDDMISDDSTWKDLEIESIDQIEIILDLEKHFQIELKDKDVIACKNFGELLELVLTAIGKGKK